MKIKINVSEEYRKARFVEAGEEIPASVIYRIPLAILTKEERALLVDRKMEKRDTILLSFESKDAPSYSSKDSFYASSLPRYVPDETLPDKLLVLVGWSELLAEFAAGLAARKAEIEEEQAQAIAQAEDSVRNKIQQARQIISAGSADGPAGTAGNPRPGNIYSSSPQLPDDHPLVIEGKEVADHLQRLYDQNQEQAKAADAKHQEELKQAKAAREAERATWIKAHGSDFLKMASKAGYDCQRKYVTERAGVEYPGFEVDFDNKAYWYSRSCPSEKALLEAVAINKAAQKDICVVVWLTTDLAGEELVYNPDEYDRDEPQREALTIEGYLGGYRLIK